MTTPAEPPVPPPPDAEAEPATDRPWEELQELVEQASAERIDAFLDSLPSGEATLAVSRLSDEEQAKLLQTLAPEAAAGLVEEMPDVQALGIVEMLPPEHAASILEELPSDQAADLIGELSQPAAEAILAELDPKDAAAVRTLAEYSDDVAGGIMVTELVAYPAQATVGEVIVDIRRHAEEYSDYDVQYVYVRGRDGRLVGVLRLRDLLLAPERMPIEFLMIKDPLTVRDTTSLDDLGDFFSRHELLGVPVVDAAGRLLGVVHRSAMEEAFAEQTEADFLKTQGIVGGDELRSMPLALRSRRRLSWLAVNILLNILSASVIAYYQDTLEQVIALAVFLPIISDMSGCSGNQAVAVSLRELTLGLIRPGELGRVLLKEVTVGVLNGLTLGVMIGVVAWAWKGNGWLGVVAGTALALNTIVAVAIGGTVPLILRRLDKDPALASGPILTTITDMCGFFLALTFASMLMTRLR